MSVTTGDVVVQTFTTTNTSTGAAADADGLPTGVLWVDGVVDAAVVTIADAAGTGKYTFSVTMPTLAVAKRVQVIVDATIAGVACAGVVWEDQAAPAVNVTYSAGVALTGRLAQYAEIAALISAGTGTGLYSETITVNDGDGLPVDGVLVQVATDSLFANVVRSGHTNNLGQVTLNFDAVGTYYGRAEISDFNVSTFTVTVS
jgi:hypothetical protein